ncbi:MAG: polyprenyl synthetase family protein [Candidatus Marsarchaeota archaeon]|nr:polyprenyl synthetase family protein [Candidatus Marsarchaeota archaeon]
MDIFSEFVISKSDRVYNKLREHFPLVEPLTNSQAARVYVDRQGFYFRAGYVFLMANMFGIDDNQALLPATAAQLCNEWLLVHDDIADDSRLRRGGPTLHKLYGLGLAMNAGDYMQNEVWGMLSDYVRDYGLKTGLRLYKKFYDIIKVTLEGQSLDIEFAQITKDPARASEEQYYLIAQKKSAYFSSYGPLQVGAVVADRSQETLNILEEIGRPAGIAAQIQNDVLDFNTKNVEKVAHQDLYEGKLTLILLHAFRNSSAEEKSRIKEIQSKNIATKTEDDINFLCDIADKYQSIEYAQNKSAEFGFKAVNALEAYENSFPDSHLANVFKTAVRRTYEHYERPKTKERRA